MQRGKWTYGVCHGIRQYKNALYFALQSFGMLTHLSNTHRLSCYYLLEYSSSVCFNPSVFLHFCIYVPLFVCFCLPSFSWPEGHKGDHGTESNVVIIIKSIRKFYLFVLHLFQFFLSTQSIYPLNICLFQGYL